MSDSNFSLAILSLGYIGINVVLIFLNALNRNDDACEDPGSVYIARCGSPASDFLFHTLEFTGTFFFAVLQAFALLYTPKSLVKVYDNPLMLKCVLFFAIVVSIVPTLLIWINIPRFEVLAHEIEYVNELTMSFVDLALLMSLVKQTDRTATPGEGISGMFMATLAVLVAVVQITIYNGMGVTADGGRLGEKPAHYCEFTFEIISALITFWFCLDNKFVADREIDEIMYGDHRDCAICHSKSVEMSDMRSSARIQSAETLDVRMPRIPRESTQGPQPDGKHKCRGRNCIINRDSCDRANPEFNKGSQGLSQGRSRDGDSETANLLG